MTTKEKERRARAATLAVSMAAARVKEAQAKLDDAVQLLAKVQGGANAYRWAQNERGHLILLWDGVRRLAGEPVLLDHDPLEDRS